jgi:hypothetical protein
MLTGSQPGKFITLDPVLTHYGSSTDNCSWTTDKCCCLFWRQRDTVDEVFTRPMQYQFTEMQRCDVTSDTAVVPSELRSSARVGV